jgi:hypothetical protein
MLPSFAAFIATEEIVDIHWFSGTYVDLISLEVTNDPTDIRVPLYGNWGGPDYPSNPTTQAAPIDDLDTLFNAHDLGQLNDHQLLTEMVKLNDNQLDAEASLYSGLAEEAFIFKLAAEGQLSPREIIRDMNDALHNIQVGLAELAVSDPNETFLFANWALESGGKLVELVV